MDNEKITKTVFKVKSLERLYYLQRSADNKYICKRKTTVVKTSEEKNRKHTKIALRKIAAQSLNVYKIIYDQEAYEVDLMLSGINNCIKF